MNLAYILKHLNLILEDEKIVYNNLLDETERNEQNEKECNICKSINDISNR